LSVYLLYQFPITLGAVIPFMCDPHYSSKDLSPKELEVGNGHQESDGESESDFEDKDEGSQDQRVECCRKDMETVFYAGFRKVPKVNRRQLRGKTKRKSKASVEEGDDIDLDKVFKVGDTVLIRTTQPSPSAGVIIAMWETRSTTGDDTRERERRMKVKVHWFLRPTELARVRAKRKHVEASLVFRLSWLVLSHR
jgi:hypothetical protein